MMGRRVRRDWGCGKNEHHPEGRTWADSTRVLLSAQSNKGGNSSQPQPKNKLSLLDSLGRKATKETTPDNLPIIE